jgi:hypothetical protein
MSLFRKPKKPISRRVFSAAAEENEKMDVDDDVVHIKTYTDKKKDKKDSKSSKTVSKTQNLLSFDDEEGRVNYSNVGTTPTQLTNFLFQIL